MTCLFEYRAKMFNYREMLVQEGKLLEAEEISQKIDELKDQEYNEARNNILTQNDVEMSELVHDREEQLRAFEESWEAHEAELVQSGINDLNALEEIQQKQVEDFRRETEEKINKTMRFRPSGHLLQQKRIFDNLIKTHQYTEAHAVRAEFTYQEQQEQQKLEIEKEKRIIKAE